MTHYLNEIRSDHGTLSAEARTHIEMCELCAAEMRLMSRIETGIRSIPHREVPSHLAAAVIRRIFSPMYRLWHLVAGTLLVMSGPMVFLKAREIVPNGFTTNLSTAIYIFYGILVFVMLFPLSSMLLGMYGSRVKEVSEKFDDYLAHPEELIPGRNNHN